VPFVIDQTACLQGGSAIRKPVGRRERSAAGGVVAGMEAELAGLLHHEKHTSVLITELGSDEVRVRARLAAMKAARASRTSARAAPTISRAPSYTCSTRRSERFKSRRISRSPMTCPRMRQRTPSSSNHSQSPIGDGHVCSPSGPTVEFVRMRSACWISSRSGTFSPHLGPAEPPRPGTLRRHSWRPRRWSA
jgi:hypothetical protein